MHPLMIVGFVVLFIVVLVAGILAAHKRREAMRTLATWLGLRFDPGKDRHLAKRYRFLNKLRRGSNRYAYNILSGSYKGSELTVFDYHYQTGSGKDTHHYNFSFFILHLPAAFPELVIGPEGIFSKIAQAVGYDDIDFESHEFSSKFCVRSANKKFAYDVCNSRMIEYLLANRDFSIEIEDSVLAISFNRQLKPELIKPNIERLMTVRSLMPDYLFSGRQACGSL
ncbi:MAG: hypothetical protein ACYSW0_10215 [Planctomycetota bacterium]|jgi:hypothetical protein